MTGKKLVEVAVEAEGGLMPIGIMNVEQALALPRAIDAKISHPDLEAGATDLFVDRRELETKLRKKN